MKRRLRSEILRHRFDAAWSYLPASVRADLRRFIRYVDEVEELAGSYLYARNDVTKAVEIYDGPLEEGTGYAVYFATASREFCDVILPTNPLITYPEGYALAIILHELAHTHDYFAHRDGVCERDDYESETLAWNHAIKWASMAIPNTSMLADIQIYANAANYADMREELSRLFAKHLKKLPT